MGEQKARKVFSLTSTGPGICNFTCAIKECNDAREIFHKLAPDASGVFEKPSFAFRTDAKTQRRRADLTGGRVGQRVSGTNKLLGIAPDRSPQEGGLRFQPNRFREAAM